jgi:mRNA interferase HigB
MFILNSTILDEFGLRYPQSRSPVKHWIQVVDSAKWKNLADIRNDFNSADYVNGVYIFNIKGNSYRLIADVIFVSQTVFVIDMLTHPKYSRIKF